MFSPAKPYVKKVVAFALRRVRTALGLQKNQQVHGALEAAEKNPVCLKARLVAQGFSLGSPCRKYFVRNAALQTAEKRATFLFFGLAQGFSPAEIQQLTRGFTPGPSFSQPAIIIFPQPV